MQSGDHMLNKNDILEIVREQLAVEYNCKPGDFDGKENVLTSPGFDDKRRKFTDNPLLFKMVTLGGNAVISADERLHDKLNEFIENKEGHWLFEYPNLKVIDDLLIPFDEKLFQTHHMFLPFGQSKKTNSYIPVKWYEGNEIHQFYGSEKFPNALCREYKPERPDLIAVTAFDNNEIIGMAGCSADTPDMWQIGIDVDEKHRSKGIGTLLVSLLKDEILIRGKIPYYGTSLSNLYSWHIALNCGFIPAWIEVGTW